VRQLDLPREHIALSDVNVETFVHDGDAAFRHRR
jgi:hypothetical protein